jgi:MOSC domain-containing protein YiiM
MWDTRATRAPDPWQDLGMSTSTLRTTAALEAALEHLRAAPTHEGQLTLVVRRPEHAARELLDEGVLDLETGLVGDNWLTRATSRAVAEGRHFDAQVTVMSSRMVELLADTDAERVMAGDQLYVDLDLSHDNLPAGTRIAVGADAVLEVSAKPHAGCKKFLARFGPDAVAFVNSEEGRRLRLRGLNARLVTGGVVRPGDAVRRLG